MLLLPESTELKGMAGADPEMVGSRQVRKALAHNGKKQPQFSRSGTYQSLQWRVGVCSMRKRPR